MAREKEHIREYRSVKLIAKFERYATKTELDPETTPDLYTHQMEKLKPEKPAKVLKYNQRTAHIGRANERRENNNWSYIHKTKLHKAKLEKENQNV